MLGARWYFRKSLAGASLLASASVLGCGSSSAPDASNRLGDDAAGGSGGVAGSASGTGGAAIAGASGSGGAIGGTASSAGAAGVGAAAGEAGTAGSTGAGAAGSTDAGGTGGSAGSPSDDIVVASTTGTLSLGFDVAIAGMGSQHLGAISMASDTGTLALDGQTFDVLLYEHQPWGDMSLDLFQGIAVLPDRWLIVWLYCQDNKLVDVYYEGTDGLSLVQESATGTCSFTTAKQNVQVNLPAIDMPTPKLVTGFTVSGTDINLPSEQPGTITLSGTTYDVYPFSTVDCTMCDPTMTGWYELHSVLWDSTLGRAAFAILYLFVGENKVEIAYSISLPDLGDPGEGMMLDATWTKMP